MDLAEKGDGREYTAQALFTRVWFCRNYMNDSLRTDLFVRFSPEAIACGCIFLAARELQVLHFKVMC